MYMIAVVVVVVQGQDVKDIDGNRAGRTGVRCSSALQRPDTKCTSEPRG